MKRLLRAAILLAPLSLGACHALDWHYGYAADVCNPYCTPVRVYMPPEEDIRPPSIPVDVHDMGHLPGGMMGMSYIQNGRGQVFIPMARGEVSNRLRDTIFIIEEGHLNDPHADLVDPNWQSRDPGLIKNDPMYATETMFAPGPDKTHWRWPPLPWDLSEYHGWTRNANQFSEAEIKAMCWRINPISGCPPTPKEDPVGRGWLEPAPAKVTPVEGVPQS